MGKKKKLEDKPQEKNTSSSSIAYKGNVVIKYVKGNKVLKSFRAHNQGCPQLFDFLTSCLALKTNWNSCPYYLKCFHSNVEPTLSNLGTDAFVNGGSIVCQSVDQVITSGSSSDDGYKTVYKFIIPSLMINQSLSNINVVALYSSKNKDDTTSPSAFIWLSGNNAIDTSQLGVGVSILILWEMSFTNSI